jgi:hypothetical protein
MCSVIGQMIISIIILVAGIILLFSQPFFLCNELDAELVEFRQWWTLADNYEAATSGIIAAFQIIHISAAYNLGTTYRQGFLKNRAFLVMYGLFFGMMAFILLADPNPLGCIFRIKYVLLSLIYISCGTSEALTTLGYGVPAFGVPESYISGLEHNVFPVYFRWTLFALTMVNLVLAVLFEKFVILGYVRKLMKDWKPLDRIELKQ